MNEKKIKALIASECKHCMVDPKTGGEYAYCAAREFFPLALIADGEPDDISKEIWGISEHLWEKLTRFFSISKMPPCMVYNRFEYPATDECIFTCLHIKNLLSQLRE